MDELVDILDSAGNPTGETAMKSEVHKKGWFHKTVHVWLYTLDGRILIQQRGKNKDTHPLLWDVSVAGHVGAGEKVAMAAVREVKEEIGYEITQTDLEKIGVFKSVQKHSEDLIDCEFHHAFLCPLLIAVRNLVPQKDEVENLKLISLVRFSEETWGMADLEKYVPHEVKYYTKIVKALRETLERF